MQEIYYVVEKELHILDTNGSIEETTGNKTITLYDIDTQAMNLVVVAEIDTFNYKNTEKEIENWLENDPFWMDVDYELVKL